MSVYSSVASSTHRPHIRKGGEDGEDGDDYLDQRQSLEAGVFGVLFTLSKEKSENNWKFSLLKAVLDFWQLFVTVIDPQQGWDINPDSTIWKIVGFWNFTILRDQSYTAYVAVLYCVVALLVVNLALCVWVAVSFKKRQFDYVWPILVLRVFTSVFFQVFDIASLNLLQIGISCQYVGVDSDVRGHVYLYPDVSCLSMPHLFHAVVSAFTLVVFVLVALLLNMAEVELNPLSHRPSSTGHSGAEVWGFAIKTCMTLVNAFLAPGWMRVQSVLMTALMCLLTWLYFRWSPHMVGWMNHVKVGSYSAVLSSAVLSIILLFHPGASSDNLESFQSSITKAMLALLAPVALLGAGASYLRLRLFTTKVVEKYRTAPLDARPKEVYRFKDPRDVEVVSRVSRKWVKLDVVDPQALSQGEAVIKAGLILFPNDAYMMLVYANFLIEVKDNSPAGYRQLQAATKMKPNAMCRFMIFVREQEQQQRAAGSHTGGTGPLDLVSYVELQRNQRLVMRHHKEALLAICAFWQCLLRNHVSFKSLAQALNKIEKSVVNAEVAYKVVLERYTDSAKLMRLYGKFLQTVKNDPWRATEYFEEAERLATKQEMEAANGDGEGGMPRVDDSTSAVIVINARGIIQLTNKVTVATFGYKKGELDNKNINTLMPAPFSQKHHGILKAYAAKEEGHTGHMVGKSRALVGLHVDRYGLPLKMSVTKASGTGEDATFMGIMEPITTDPNICLAWIGRTGSISCVDQRFGMWFGYSPAELLGTAITNVLSLQGTAEGPTDVADPEAMLTRLMDEADARPVPENAPVDQLPAFQDSPAAAGLCVAHKYGGNVQCQACVVPWGTPTVPLHLLMLRRINPEPTLMLVADPKGAIRHLSSDLALLLGYASGAPNICAMKVTDLMQPTWGIMHGPKWLKEPEPEVPPYSCRAGQALTQQLLDVKGKPVPVRMAVQTTDEHGEPLHIVKMTKSTPQQALDDRRLQLTIDHRGVITGVLGATPAALFGLEPRALAGRPLHTILPLLADPEANGGQDVGLAAGDAVQDEFHHMGLDVFATPVLNALIKKAMDRPGYSWRVGVSPPGEEASIRKQVKDPALVQSMLAKVCKSAVMQMDVTTNMSTVYSGSASNRGGSDRPGSGAGGSHLSVVVSLWRADLLSVCVEVDKDGAILKVENEDVCPPGLLFGVPTARLRGEALLQFLGAANLVELGAEPEKKGGLKTTAGAHAATKMQPSVVLTRAQHYDQQPLCITSQVVIKAHKRWVLLHVSKPTRGSATALASLLPGHSRAGLSRGAESQALVPRPPAVPAPAVASLPAPSAARLMERQLSGRAPLAVPQAASPLPPASPRNTSPGGQLRYSSEGMRLLYTKDSAYAAPSGPDSPSRSKATRFALPHQPLPPGAQNPADPSLGLSHTGDGDVHDLPDALEAARGSDQGEDTGQQMLQELQGVIADELHQAMMMVGDVEGSRRGPLQPLQPWAGSASRQASRLASPRSHSPADMLHQDTTALGEGSDGEGSDKGKPLGGAKMARVSTWVATDGEEYPVGKQPDIDPDSKLAKGLRAGVVQGAMLPPADEGRNDNDGGRRRYSVEDSGRPEGGHLNLLMMAGVGAKDKDNKGLRHRLSSGLPNPLSPKPVRSNKVAPAGMPYPSNASEMDGEGRTPKGAPPPPSDDARSEGGDSAGSGASKMSGMSGMSGLSGVSDGEDSQDYRRGKRYRKLAKMLDGVEAQKVIRRFKLHASFLIALLMLAQTVSFAMMVYKINLQMTFMRSLSSSGFVSRFNMEINLYVRTIDNILTNKTVPGIYQEGVEYYLNKVKYANDEMHMYNEFIYFHMEHMQQLDDTYGLRTAFDITPRRVFMDTDAFGSAVYQNMTLWQLLSRFHLAVNNFLNLHEYWLATRGGTSKTSDFLFLKNNGLTLYSAYREVLDSLLYKAVANTDAVNQLHIIFLVLEGCVLCSFVAAYFTILLRQVSNQRYALYSVFMMIPAGLVRALANQSVKLLDDSDSDEEEEEGGEAGEVVQKHAEPTPDAKALRKEISNLNRKRTQDIEGGSSRGGPTISGPSAIAVKTKWEAGERLGFRQRFVARLRKLLGMPDPTSSKRQLVRDSRETLWRMLPIIVWGLLVMIIYVVGYVMLKDIASPVAGQNVINYVAGRALRAAFFAQEYVTQEDPKNSEAQRQDLTRHITRLSAATEVMLVGSEAYTQRGVNETFALVAEGVTYRGNTVANILFGADMCHRIDQTKCRQPGDLFYAASREGVVPMLYTYLDNLVEMQALPVDMMFKNGSSGAMASDQFQTIWNVGTLDLDEGIQALVNAHEEAVVSMYSQVRSLHIILFVLGWAFATFFLLMLLRPLLRRSRREGKRVAELLSQLPPELNVEKLVNNALRMQASVKESGGGAKDGRAGRADSERQPLIDPADDKDWKSIMKSSFTAAASKSSFTNGVRR